MGLPEIIVLAVSLAMDAFAAAVCKGLAMKKVSLGDAAICGAWFGGFQGIMPLAGYFLGVRFVSYIIGIEHWIVFVLLVTIGGNMIREAIHSDASTEDNSLKVKDMLIMSLATSIDALAVGVTFVCMPASLSESLSKEENIFAAATIICIITFVMTCAGVKIGSSFGERYRSKAEIAGGAILCVLGMKYLLEHLLGNA